MSVLIFLVISYIILSYSLSRLFPKAGVESVKGWIPGVNFAEWCKIIGRKPTYALWLLFPVVNIFIFCGMAVDMVRSFGRLGLWDNFLAVVYAPIPFLQIASSAKHDYLGPTLQLEAEYAQQLKEAHDAGNKRQYDRLVAKNPYKKSVGREWAESIFFAVFAASFIRMFLLEAYVIPTSSMEGSLRVGDYLFVSKAHYGIRTPQTVLQLPLLHNRIPILNRESYLSSPSLPYFRLPGLTKIKRNDPVVFNWPVGDRVYVTPNRSWTDDQVKRGMKTQDPRYKRIAAKYTLIERPMDKTDFYIKRCVGLPGDTLEVINQQVYIDGQPIKHAPKTLHNYYVDLPEGFTQQDLEGLDIYPGDINGGQPVRRSFTNLMSLSASNVDRLRTLGATVKSPPHGDPVGLFPFDQKNFPFKSVDNYGPLYIPKAGATIDLNLQNLAAFERVIDVYEDHDIEVKGKQIFIDGREAKQYTFKYDYYWMMGDNRNNSEDSRMWGFVPETHIVGKPLFVWFSTKYGSIANGIRFDRMFSGARKMGEE